MFRIFSHLCVCVHVHVHVFICVCVCVYTSIHMNVMYMRVFNCIVAPIYYQEFKIYMRESIELP